MKRWLGALLSVAALALAAPAYAAGTVERLYVIDCGHGVAGDISLWSPGVDEGKSKDFVDTCYLIRHAKGWLIWDTGIADAVAAMPDGLAPSNPKATRWLRRTTLAAELQRLGVTPGDIAFVAISHTHPDHIGNVELFPQAMLLVQKAEYEWPNQDGSPRFKPAHPVTKLEGRHDVFGDGSVVVLPTPGHTPGHQSLLVHLQKTGAVVLSGDLAHFSENWTNRRVPSMNVDKTASVASMEQVAALMQAEQAQLWINHDKVQRDGLRLAPEFYE